MLRPNRAVEIMIAALVATSWGCGQQSGSQEGATSERLPPVLSMAAQSPEPEVPYVARGTDRPKVEPPPAATSTPPVGKKRALLVGCTKYDSRSITPLRGPANDVKLLRKMLVEKYGFPNDDRAIVVLSEEEAARNPLRRPTRANILREFGALAQSVEPDSQVVVLLSGHGGRTPDNDPPGQDEVDGYDEVFCPVDVELQEATGAVDRNGIIDDELQAWLELMSRQAHVWLIADSCNNGTLTRSTGDVARGIGDIETTRSGGENDLPERHDAPKGSVTAFYAAPPTLKTFDTTIDGVPYGLFTYTLCKVMAASDPRSLTYRTLIQGVYDEYVKNRRTTPTPQMEGESKDTVLFGSVELPNSGIRITAAGEGYQINAGRLHGLMPGSILAAQVEHGAVGGSGGPGAPGGYVRVVEAGIFQSRVEPCPFRNVGMNTQQSLAGCRYCQLVSQPYEGLRQLNVAIDSRTATGQRLPEQALEYARRELSALDGGPGSLIKVVNDTTEADWLIQVAALERMDIVYLSPSDRFGLPGDDEALRMSPPDQPQVAWLRSELESIARACNLVEIAHQDAKRACSQVKVDVQLRRLADTRDRAGTPVALESDLTLTEGEFIGIQVTNPNPFALYVTVLFVNSRYETKALFPRMSGQAGHRLEAAGRMRDTFMPVRGAVNAQTQGLERMIVIAVKEQPQSEPPDFTFLATGSTPLTRAAKSPLEQLLSCAVLRDAKRDLDSFNETEQPIEDHTFRVLAWHTVRKKDRPAAPAPPVPPAPELQVQQAPPFQPKFQPAPTASLPQQPSSMPAPASVNPLAIVPEVTRGFLGIVREGPVEDLKAEIVRESSGKYHTLNRTQALLGTYGKRIEGNRLLGRLDRYEQRGMTQGIERVRRFTTVQRKGTGAGKDFVSFLGGRQAWQVAELTGKVSGGRQDEVAYEVVGTRLDQNDLIAALNSDADAMNYFDYLLKQKQSPCVVLENVLLTSYSATHSHKLNLDGKLKTGVTTDLAEAGVNGERESFTQLTAPIVRCYQMYSIRTNQGKIVELVAMDP